MTKGIKHSVHIRWMVRRDMPTVLAIEEDAFEFPWTEEEFIRCLRQRSVIGMVAERCDELAGYMIYDLEKYKLTILNFAVDVSHRRSGIGSAMAWKLSEKLSANRRNRIEVKVRESNLNAQLFFRAMGFRAFAVTDGDYEDTDEQAYWMQFQCDVTTGSDYQRRW